jgi:hypothetical protein
MGGVSMRAIISAWTFGLIIFLSACASEKLKTTAIDMGADLGPTCLQDSDCGQNEYCRWAPEHACGRDHTPGVCTAFQPENACPNLAFYVCGCDNNLYNNECFTEVSYGVSVDYGGPCREGKSKSCRTSAECPQDDVFSFRYCVDDPRDEFFRNDEKDGDGCAADDGGAVGDGGATPESHPGLCVHANYLCSSNNDCLSAIGSTNANSPGTQACIGTTDTIRHPSTQNPACSPGVCVFTTGVSCTSQKDCEDPALCMPIIGCDLAAGACPSVCVRP